MTSLIAPDSQGTGPLFVTGPTTLLDSLARHRTDQPSSGVPAWFLIAMTVTAAAAACMAMAVRSLPLMFLALGYAVVAFAADVYAAVRARRAGVDE